MLMHRLKTATVRWSRSVAALSWLWCAVLAAPWSVHAEATDGAFAPAPLSYTRVAMDAEQVSYFAPAEVPFEMVDFAPPAAPVGVAARSTARSIVFTTVDAAWRGDWHPTPRRQFAVMMRGEVEITVGSGEKRRFGPGDVFLLEDTAGRGHDSRVVSATPAVLAMIAVPAEASDDEPRVAPAATHD